MSTAVLAKEPAEGRQASWTLRGWYGHVPMQGTDPKMSSD